ncbi:hypothetical protein E4J89_07135 [Arthrobacter sp. CAU 1506]|uniref:phosphotransferase n=1 Tax=Arthrobacter sp. CAU 1506 TaxID=2560052 RepID=UPI0010AD2D95|nr:phosphotransferase [Arthrobacter sp. CAU 1506]TJY70460.1 hypothetical protein E4J89_07135 [Arthrobacter sp. CAU 1506]
MTEPSFQPVPGRVAGSTGGSASDPASIGGVGNAPSGKAEPGAGLTGRRLHNSVPRQDWRLTAAADEPLLFRVLEAAYDLGRWRVWHRAKRGTSNLSWFVSTDAGEVVLRRSHNLKTVAGAQFECSLIDHLRRHGYPAPPIQRSRDGAICVQVGGVLHTVMHLMPGHAFDPGNTDQLAAAAQGLARYHAIVSKLTPAEQDRSSGLAALGHMGQEHLFAAIDVVSPLLDVNAGAEVQEEARYLAGRMEQLNIGLGQRQKDLTALAIHGSYGQSALLFDGGLLTGVLDFDRSAHDLLTLDLAYAVRSFCRQDPVGGPGDDIDKDLCRTFLRHYRSHTPLADTDLAALPEVFQAHRLIRIAKKCNNLLIKQVIAPRQPKDAHSFARLLKREGALVRWLTENPITLAEDA